MKKFLFYKQNDGKDCGPTCLLMVCRYYGKTHTFEEIRHLTGYSNERVSLHALGESAEKLGFKVLGIELPDDQLSRINTPAILHWDKHHYVVLVKAGKRKVIVADPEKGIISYSKKDFLSHWLASGTGSGKGIILLLEPLIKAEHQKEKPLTGLKYRLLIKYLYNSWWRIAQVFGILILSSLVSLIFPFLTQSIVDIGINGRDLQFILIVLIAQVMLIFSQTFMGFLRSRLLLKVANILNIQLLSDFWIKLMRLPLSYFAGRNTGDTLQRIADHKTVQRFLTTTSLSTLFSIFNFLVYSVILTTYNIYLLLIFFFFTGIYFIWLKLFIRVRRRINTEIFQLAAQENNASIELIQGMSEIRLNHAEEKKRWEWEDIQIRSVEVNFRNLNYSQLQEAGAIFINQVQGVFMSFIVARFVIEGQLTLGAMLAVQYIIGQLIAPVQQWIGFVQSWQDARMSLERLNEIHHLPDEKVKDKSYYKKLPDAKEIVLANLSFSYPGMSRKNVLNDINLTIPQGRITAIVGTSGSGKTTLLKLLLRIYEQNEGQIFIGQNNSGPPALDSMNLQDIDYNYWRSNCGAVLQDGYIFNDTIAGNIALGADEINHSRLQDCSRLANILSFIESLPEGFLTRIGNNGLGLSQGQKQRILIARVIYKNPHYIFFDEATNALDSSNEEAIIKGLQHFFTGKTVVIVAHRLSTIVNADKIIVLENGRVAEEGSHKELIDKQGKYHQLFQKQMTPNR